MRRFGCAHTFCHCFNSGATESCAYVKKLDFPPSKIVFDAQFDKQKK